MRPAPRDSSELPDEWLVEVLRREAATYEPDRRRIMARISPALKGHRSAGGRPRWAVLVPLSATAVTVVATVVALQAWNETSAVTPSLRSEVSESSP